MAKRTAANSPLLAEVKKAMNAKIFKKTSAILNADGEHAARKYLNTFFRTGCCPWYTEQD